MATKQEVKNLFSITKISYREIYNRFKIPASWFYRAMDEETMHEIEKPNEARMDFLKRYLKARIRFEKIWLTKAKKEGIMK